MSAPQSLFDALIQILRADVTVTAAFGDTWNVVTQSGVIKFYADWADQQPVPYLVFQEVGESYEYMTVTSGIKNLIATGTGLCVINQSTRLGARQLGMLVCSALNDCDEVSPRVTWPGFNGVSQLMNFRMAQASFAPIADIGPSVPAVFQRVISFEYEYQGQI